jgi:hypothetical protein
LTLAPKELRQSAWPCGRFPQRKTDSYLHNSETDCYIKNRSILDTEKYCKIFFNIKEFLLWTNLMEVTAELNIYTVKHAE